MTTLTLRECAAAALAFCAGLILVALVKRPCPPSPRPLAPALEADLETNLETNLDTDADASGDRYGEYYR